MHICILRTHICMHMRFTLVLNTITAACMPYAYACCCACYCWWWKGACIWPYIPMWGATGPPGPAMGMPGKPG